VEKGHEIWYCTWCLYRSGSLTTVAKELARYKLDLVGVQKVRWDKRGTVRAGDYIFIYGKGNSYHQLEQDCLYSIPQNSISSYESRVCSGRVTHIVMRGCWCNVIDLNVHAPSEEKKWWLRTEGRVYEDLEQVFGNFPRYEIKILIGEFNAKLERGIFSSRQLGMRIYIRIVMPVMLE